MEMCRARVDGETSGDATAMSLGGTSGFWNLYNEPEMVWGFHMKFKSLSFCF